MLLFSYAGIFPGTSQLAYRRQKLGRSPSPARGSGGMLPREIFEKSDAIICIFVFFEGHKIATWWLYFDVGGVCIELESDLFLIDMAAEGRGNTILTRALQLVPGPSKLLADSKPTLTSFLLRNGRRNVFSPPIVFLPSRLTRRLFTSFIVASNEAKSA